MAGGSARIPINGKTPAAAYHRYSDPCGSSICGLEHEGIVSHNISGILTRKENGTKGCRRAAVLPCPVSATVDSSKNSSTLPHPPADVRVHKADGVKGRWRRPRGFVLPGHPSVHRLENDSAARTPAGQVTDIRITKMHRIQIC